MRKQLKIECLDIEIGAQLSWELKTHFLPSSPFFTGENPQNEHRFNVILSSRCSTANMQLQFNNFHRLEKPQHPEAGCSILHFLILNNKHKDALSIFGLILYLNCLDLPLLDWTLLSISNLFPMYLQTRTRSHFNIFQMHWLFKKLA